MIGYIFYKYGGKVFYYQYTLYYTDELFIIPYISGNVSFPHKMQMYNIFPFLYNTYYIKTLLKYIEI